MKVRLPNGMGGGPQNMNQMIKQAQKMQEEVEELREELDGREYTVSAGGNMVTVHINGKLEILNIELKPEIVDADDIESLQDVVVAAVNEAIKTVQDKNASEMEKVTGSINLPGIF